MHAPNPDASDSLAPHRDLGSGLPGLNQHHKQRAIEEEEEQEGHWEETEEGPGGQPQRTGTFLHNFLTCLQAVTFMYICTCVVSTSDYSDIDGDKCLAGCVCAAGGQQQQRGAVNDDEEVLDVSEEEELDLPVTEVHIVCLGHGNSQETSCKTVLCL
jgi:hypothetical protein